MGSLEKSTKIAEQVRLDIDVLLNVDIVKLARPDLLPDINFKSIVQPINLYIEYIKQISDLRFEFLSTTHLENLHNKLTDLLGYTRSVISFSVSGDDAPVPRSQNLAHVILNFHDDLVNSFVPLATLQYFTGELSARFDGLEASRLEMTNAERHMSTLLSKCEKTLDDVTKIKSTLEEQLPQITATNQATIFSKDSDNHKTASHWWLLFVSVFILGILSLAVWSYAFAISPSASVITSEQLIQVIISKFIAFSILSYGLILCGRNYRAHRHNSVLSDHR